MGFTRMASTLAVMLAVPGFGLPASAATPTRCKISYTLKGWSAFYKEYRGSGTVTCRNGQRADVSIVAHGGGFTFGKSEVEKGRGVFTPVDGIGDLFGTYAAADGHAGAYDSAEGWVMTNGHTQLALSGIGRGINFGFSFGGFTIARR